VLQGPGCLNYSVILRADRPETASIPAASRFVMERTRDLLQPLLAGEVQVQGHTDLTWNGRKFSGNAQRRKREHLLFHGTILHDFDPGLVERWLAVPSVAPEYRRGRRHADFLTNVPLPAELIKGTLRDGWSAKEELRRLPDWSGLMAERYGREEWNLRF
jgi:lipoate-protein ligase A